MTYIDDVRREFRARCSMGDRTQLEDLYVFLALVKGEETTLEDVHDAWSVYMSRMKPDHFSVKPFGQLAPSVQALDGKYAGAIVATGQALRLHAQGNHTCCASECTGAVTEEAP